MQPHIINEIIIYNFTEVQGTLSLNDVLQEFAFQQKILSQLGINKQHSQSQVASKFSANILKSGLMSVLSGFSSNPLMVWIICCSAYVTI